MKRSTAAMIMTVGFFLITVFRQVRNEPFDTALIGATVWTTAWWILREIETRRTP